MFNRSKKKQTDRAIEDLEYVVIKRGKENDVVLLSPPKWINKYRNGYIWEYIVVDTIYNLLKGFTSAVEIKFEQYSEQLNDIVGYKVYSLKRDSKSTSKIFYSIGGVKKDIIIELKKGMDIWSYDGLLTFYVVETTICDESNLNKIISDHTVLTIEPCNDGNDLQFRFNKNFITDQQLTNKVEEVLEAYRIGLKREI